MRLVFLLLSQWLGALCAAAAEAREITLTGGWSEFPPYSYLTTSQGVSRWQGFDVDLLNAIAERANMIVVADKIPRGDHIAGLKSGEIQIAPYSVITDERQTFATFSIPYRTETMVLILRKDGVALGSGGDVAGLIAEFKARRFRMALEEGVALPNETMRAFLADPGYEDAVFRMRAFDLVTELLNEQIDGFWVDRVEAAHLHKTLGVSHLLYEHPLQLHGNLHFMFSRETVPPDVVSRVNAAIESVHADGTYQRLNTKYAFPIVVALSLDNFWFQLVDIVGTIAFALSGLFLAHRYNYDVFGALVLASLPAVGGGVVRDLISRRDEIAVFQNPIYIYLIVGLVFGGFLLVRLYQWLPARARHTLSTSRIGAYFQRLAGGAVEVCDAVGLAAFTVTGVVVALVTNSTPFWVWGPILAAITAAGGGILRDITRSDPEIPLLKGALYPEIAVFWGLFLSIFLLWEARLLEPNHISAGIIITFFGALLSRLAVIGLRLRSPTFSGRSA